MSMTPLLTSLSSAALLTTTIGAQAFCIVPSGFPPNEVGLSVQTVPTSPSTVQFDMDGVQAGLNDQRAWATHGTLVALISPTGGVKEWVASWTKNTFRVAEEWVCRMTPFDLPIIASGTGVFHTVDHSTPTFPTTIEQCQFLATDCK